MINIIYIFGVIGVLDTLYLIYNKIKKSDVACPFFPKEWCHKVQHSKQSKTFGVSNSILGFCMYIIILILAFLYSISILPIWPLFVIVIFGFLFSLYFMYIQAFVLKAFCTWCVLSFINFTVIISVLIFG